jgi:hypothetical protein
VPAIVSHPKDPTGWVEPAKGEPLAFQTAGQQPNTALAPLYKVSGERYVVYWKTTSSSST